MPKVLAVDDDPVLLKFLKDALEYQGFTVWTAQDARETFSILSRELPDAVLLDVNLPGIDGFEICMRIKKQAPDLPVIMLTAETQVGNIVKGLDGGADDYIGKPFEFRELLARLKTQLRSVDRIRARVQELLRERWDEINEGFRLVQSLQRSSVRAAVPGMMTSVEMIAQGKVGGDFYDLVELPNDRVALLVGDAFGSGLAASLMMAATFSLFRRLLPTASSPHSVLEKVNTSLIKDLQEMESYVTAFLAFWDRKTRILTFSNAGHFPPLVVRKKRLKHEFLRCKGLFLGAMKDADYPEMTVSLEKGDRIFLYTDGLLEMQKPDGTRLCMPHLYRLMLKSFHLPVTRLTDYLMQEMRRASGGRPNLRDDFTFFIAEID